MVCFLAALCERVSLRFRRKNVVTPAKHIDVEPCSKVDKISVEDSLSEKRSVSDDVAPLCMDKVRRNSRWKNNHREFSRRVSIGSCDKSSSCSTAVSFVSGVLPLQVS